MSACPPLLIEEISHTWGICTRCMSLHCFWKLHNSVSQFPCQLACCSFWKLHSFLGLSTSFLTPCSTQKLHRHVQHTCLPVPRSFGQQALTVRSQPPLRICAIFTANVLCPHCLSRKNYVILPPSWDRSCKIITTVLVCSSQPPSDLCAIFLDSAPEPTSFLEMCSAQFQSPILSLGHLHSKTKYGAS